MTLLSILLVVINLAFLTAGVIYFSPRRTANTGGDGANSRDAAANDANRTVSLLKAIGDALSDHATSLGAVKAQPSDASETLTDDQRGEFDKLRQKNKSTGDTIEKSNEQLATVLSKYGDLYRSERRRIESYTQNVNELEQLLDDIESPDGTNRVLLEFVRDMIQENRQLQAKVSDCQEQVSELIARSVKSERDARTDPLTQLPNRRAWDERLAECESERPFSIGLIDVDGFKLINDQNGHAAGDAMLTLIGTILRNVHEVSAFRIGGDEFALLMPIGLEEKVAERIRNKVANSVLNFAGEKLSVSVSIGIARFGEDESIDSVLRNADEALYLAKDARGNSVVTSRPDAEPEPAVFAMAEHKVG